MKLKCTFMYGQLEGGNKLSYKIPFPLGMDNFQKQLEKLVKKKLCNLSILKFQNLIPNQKNTENQIIQRVKDYMKSKGVCC